MRVYVETYIPEMWRNVSATQHFGYKGAQMPCQNVFEKCRDISAKCLHRDICWKKGMSVFRRSQLRKKPSSYIASPTWPSCYPACRPLDSLLAPQFHGRFVSVAAGAIGAVAEVNVKLVWTNNLTWCYKILAEINPLNSILKVLAV